MVGIHVRSEKLVGVAIVVPTPFAVNSNNLAKMTYSRVDLMTRDLRSPPTSTQYFP
jgi:hypothetical protein